MIQRMLASALFAGFGAGLLAALLHFAFVQEKILLAEEYESGARVHFGGVADAEAHHNMTHDHGTAEAAPEGEAATAEPAAEGAEPAGGHNHEHGAPGEEPSPLKRNTMTVLFFGLTYVSYGLLLVAAFAAAEQAGHKVEPSQGLLWGLAGFVALQLAPALGLAPELPGTPAADLTLRQIWWWGTVIATVCGLVTLAFGKGPLRWVVGIALLAAPHIIGAPELGDYFGVAPPELASEFAARSMGVAMIAWLSLGWFAANLWTGRTQ